MGTQTTLIYQVQSESLLDAKPKFFVLLRSVSFAFILGRCLFFYSSKYLLEGPEQDSNYDPLPEERPGGFDWGQGERLGDEDRQ